MPIKKSHWLRMGCAGKLLSIPPSVYCTPLMVCASKMYAIAIAGVNNEGKSTEVHQLVGHTSYPLTLHIETSINDISYYFTEHGEYATELTITSVTITDMNGVVVKTCNAAQNEKISIADLTPGTLYILNVTLDDGRTFSKQFMKK